MDEFYCSIYGETPADPVRALSDDDLASELEAMTAPQPWKRMISEAARRLRTERTDFVAGLMVGGLSIVAVVLISVAVATTWQVGPFNAWWLVIFLAVVDVVLSIRILQQRRRLEGLHGQLEAAQDNADIAKMMGVAP